MTRDGRSIAMSTHITCLMFTPAFAIAPQALTRLAPTGGHYAGAPRSSRRPPLDSRSPCAAHLERLRQADASNVPLRRRS
jgi:hypothetical protein